MNNFILENSTKTVFGEGCVKEYLASFAGDYGPNVLLAYGGGSARRSGVYYEVYRILRAAGKTVAEFANISPNPTYALVREGAKTALERHVDLILALGGGSVVDWCKVVSMAAVYRGDFWEDFWARQGVVDFEPLPVGAIPTTTGTGSERNGRAFLSSGETRGKIGRNYPKCTPRFALLDPSYTLTLPPSEMVGGGFDAFSRVMEIYFSPPEEETVSDDLSEAIMRGMVRDLRASVQRSDNYAARSNLMWEAVVAGGPLPALGKRAAFPCRRIARRLWAATGCGYTSCLAAVQLAYYRRRCLLSPGKFARFARRVWELPPEGRSEEALGRAGVDALEGFLMELGLPRSLREAGIPAEENLADLVGRPAAPEEKLGLTQEELLQLLQDAH